MRHSLLLGIPILVSVLALIGAAEYQYTEEPDADGDGMPDVYELFFGLDPANPDDTYLDYDGDHFSNLRESVQLTDPFAPDTDRDGFEDDADANPISRAYIQWGAPQFTTGDQYDYAHPDWLLRAYKTDGEWLVTRCEGSTNSLQAYDSAWYVPACVSNGIGSLSIDLDRTLLTNNLRYAVHYSSGRAGQPVPPSDSVEQGCSTLPSLYVDLLDTNGAVLVENLYGNLMTGSNEEAAVILEIPTAKITEAAVIQLRHGEGEAIVYEGLLYIDEDGDGLDADQETQLGTSDYCADTDGDGVSDYDEVFVYHTDPCKPDNYDDRDKDKKTGIIYVDQAIGNDQHTGRASLPTSQRVGTRQDGPKKTIHKGMAAVDEDGAHTLIIKSGAYNENLNLRGKNVKVVIEGNVRL